MRKIMRATMTSAVALGLVLGSTTGAHATSQTQKDKRSDVIQYKDAEDYKGKVLGKKSSDKSGINVTSAKYDLNSKRLKVTLKFAELSPKTVHVDLIATFKGAQWGPNFSISNNGSKKKITVFDHEKNKKVCTANLKRDTGKKGSLAFEFKRKCFGKHKQLAFAGVVWRLENNKKPTGVYYGEFISPKKTRQWTFTKYLKS